MQYIAKGLVFLGSLPFIALRELLQGPQPNHTNSKFKKGAVTLQDHGLYCKICGRKRFCRVD